MAYPTIRVLNQVMIITVTASGGTFTITYGANTTAGQAFNVTAANLQTALTGLASIGASNVLVTLPETGMYVLDFSQGALANQTLNVVTLGTGSLTGGSATVACSGGGSTVTIGSDTVASGAGPTTAITGTTGRTRSAASQLRFGLFGATDDLSGVSTTGNHVLFASISTAGQRNFSAISGTVKNTRQTGSDAAITGTSASLTVGSTSGWTAGDIIKVTGAGAAGADLYTTIVSVDSATTATLTDTAGTTVGPSATWENPKQVTLATGQGVNTGTTNTTWAIGGKRATGGQNTNSFKLASNNSGSGDAMPGWTTECESGHYETIGSTWDWRRAGDATDGPITLQGTFGAASMPIVVGSANGNLIVYRGVGQVFQDLELRNSNATKTASIAIASGSANQVITRRIKVARSTQKFWKGTNVSLGEAFDCEFGYCASHGVEYAGGNVRNCHIHHCGGSGINIASGSTYVMITGNVIVFNTADGITNAMSGGGVSASTIANNVIHGNSSDGLEFSAAYNLRIASGEVLNNLFTYNGIYGVNFSGANFTDAALNFSLYRMLNNCFYTNTSGKFFPTTLTVSENEVTTSPADVAIDATTDYAGTVNGTNFNVNANMKAVGYPSVVVGNGSATRSYVDIGPQRQEPTGGTSYVPIRGGKRIDSRHTQGRNVRSLLPMPSGFVPVRTVRRMYAIRPASRPAAPAIIPGLPVVVVPQPSRRTQIDRTRRSILASPVGSPAQFVPVVRVSRRVVTVPTVRRPSPVLVATPPQFVPVARAIRRGESAPAARRPAPALVVSQTIDVTQTVLITNRKTVR